MSLRIILFVVSFWVIPLANAGFTINTLLSLLQQEHLAESLSKRQLPFIPGVINLTNNTPSFVLNNTSYYLERNGSLPNSYRVTSEGLSGNWYLQINVDERRSVQGVRDFFQGRSHYQTAPIHQPHLVWLTGNSNTPVAVSLLQPPFQGLPRQPSLEQDNRKLGNMFEKFRGEVFEAMTRLVQRQKKEEEKKELAQKLESEMRKELNRLDLEKRQKEAECNEMKGQLRKSEERIMKLERANQALLEQVDDVNKKVKLALANENKVRAQFDKSEANSLRLAEENKSLKADNGNVKADAENNKKEHQSQLSKLQEQIKSHERDEVNKNNKISDLESRIKELENINKKIKSVEREKRIDEKRLISKIESMKKESNGLKEEIASLKEFSSSLEDRIKLINDLAVKTGEDNSGLNKKNEKMKKLCAQSLSDLQKTRDEVARLRTEIKEKHGRLAQQDKTIEELNEYIASLVRNNQSYETHIRQLRSQLAESGKRSEVEEQWQQLCAKYGLTLTQAAHHLLTLHQPLISQPQAAHERFRVLTALGLEAQTTPADGFCLFNATLQALAVPINAENLESLLEALVNLITTNSENPALVNSGLTTDDSVMRLLEIATAVTVSETLPRALWGELRLLIGVAIWQERDVFLVATTPLQDSQHVLHIDPQGHTRGLNVCEARRSLANPENSNAILIGFEQRDPQTEAGNHFFHLTRRSPEGAETEAFGAAHNTSESDDNLFGRRGLDTYRQFCLDESGKVTEL